MLETMGTEILGSGNYCPTYRLHFGFFDLVLSSSLSIPPSPFQSNSACACIPCRLQRVLRLLRGTLGDRGHRTHQRPRRTSGGPGTSISIYMRQNSPKNPVRLLKRVQRIAWMRKIKTYVNPSRSHRRAVRTPAGELVQGERVQCFASRQSRPIDY